MKTLFLLIIFILIMWYLFVPNNIKNEYLEKAWIDYSFDENTTVENPWDIRELEFDKNWEANFSWDIASWEKTPNTSWWVKNMVNCYKNDEQNYFSGNRIIHKILLEKDASIEVKLIDETKSWDLSLVVYKIKPALNTKPEELTYAHKCISKINTNNYKTVEMQWDTIRSDIYIVVVWSNWVSKWSYKLDIKQK